jgi:hypothetical protein
VQGACGARSMWCKEHVVQGACGARSMWCKEHVVRGGCNKIVQCWVAGTYPGVPQAVWSARALPLSTLANPKSAILINASSVGSDNRMFSGCNTHKAQRKPTEEAHSTARSERSVPDQRVTTQHGEWRSSTCHSTCHRGALRGHGRARGALQAVPRYTHTHLQVPVHHKLGMAVADGLREGLHHTLRLQLGVLLL